MSLKEFILLNRLHNLRGISIFNICYPAGYTAKLKSGTPADTMIIIISGEVRCITKDGGEYTLNSGLITCFPRNYSRTSIYLKNTHLISVHIDSDKSEFSQSLKQIPSASLDSYHQICLDMLKKTASGEVHGDLFVASCMYGLLDCVVQASLPEIPVNMRAVHTAKLRIENDFKEDKPITDYAAEAVLSYSTFRRLFTKYTGYPPAKYRQLLRLEYVKLLVSSGECNIGEAAQRAGFCSLSYLCRQSRLLCGCSPTELVNIDFDI